MVDQAAGVFAEEGSTFPADSEALPSLCVFKGDNPWVNSSSPGTEGPPTQG